MKKALLLLFLFLSVTLQAQPPTGMLNPYNVCDDASNDGFAIFDLASTIPQILSSVDPAIHTVTFHPSDTDSANNTNVITNTSSYTNTIPNSQTIGVRIVNNSTNEVFLAGMNLIVNPLPTANPAQLSCAYEPSELNMCFLSQADSQITGGMSGSTVTYYHTLADAQTGINPINPNFSYTATASVETLYARVTNNTTGCYSITTLTLNTMIIGSCPTPTNLVASQITDTSFALSWASGGPVGYSLACLVPLGAQPSDAFAVVTSGSPGPYVFTGLNPNTCYDVYVKAVCSPTNSSQWSVPLTVCMPDCANTGNCSQALILTAFLDSNNNGVKDTGEVNFNYGNFVYQINDSGTNLYGNSNNNGSYYIFDDNPTNSYDISFVVNASQGSYYTSSVTHNNITIPTGSGANNLYFPIVNIQPLTDASVYLYPAGAPRPGFTYANIIYYKNNGSQTIANGTLTFTKNSNLSISSISQSGTTPTSNGFTYDFTNLAPFEARYIYVYLSVPTIPTVNLGDFLTNSLSVQINNDDYITNNNASLTQMVVGSYDPNDKSEAHGGKIGLDTFTSNDYLYYTVNFENTGTASAEFIRVEDMLDARLDENTFEMINASHNVNTKREGNQLTWHFYNINLPPTVTNPNNSHGYVHFRIKLKAGYAIGDIIPNTASIYFDYNPAIVTNTFNTELFETLGTSGFEQNNFVIAPNPAKNSVQINLQSTTETINTILIADVLGKTIRNINNVSGNQNTVDVSDLSQGVYFITITTENNFKQVKKLIIE